MTFLMNFLFYLQYNIMLRVSNLFLINLLFILLFTPLFISLIDSSELSTWVSGREARWNDQPSVHHAWQTNQTFLHFPDHKCTAAWLEIRIFHYVQSFHKELAHFRISLRVNHTNFALQMLIMGVSLPLSWSRGGRPEEWQSLLSMSRVQVKTERSPCYIIM